MPNQFSVGETLSGASRRRVLFRVLSNEFKSRTYAYYDEDDHSDDEPSWGLLFNFH